MLRILGPLLVLLVLPLEWSGAVASVLVGVGVAGGVWSLGSEA